MVSLASLDCIHWKLRHAQRVKCEIESCYSDTECCQFFQIFKVGIKWVIKLYLNIVY